MNVFYRLLSSFANALVALWRWATAVEEDAGYVVPAGQLRRRELTVAFDAAYPDPVFVAAHQMPGPTDEEATALAWTFPAGVSLRKLEPMPSLVRPFVGHLSGRARPDTVDLAKKVVMARRAVGRATVAAVDALGFPLAPMADENTPTLGIFNQVSQAWRLRTGNDNAVWT